MTSDETDPLPSLGELLGIDVLADLPELPDEAWERALDIATDPDTPLVDSSLVPVDDEIDPETITVDPADPDPELDPDADLHTPDIVEPDAVDDAGTAAGVDEIDLPDPGIDYDDPGSGL